MEVSKVSFKKIRSLFGINEIILTLYLFLIVSIHIFVLWNGDLSFSFIGLLATVLAGSGYLCSIIVRRVKVIDTVFKETELDRKEKMIWLLFFFAVTFFILLLWYLAYYPGVFSNDAIYQYGQAINGIYTDWHPILQTLFAFTLPLKITGRVDSIILFQIIEFSSLITYMAYTFLQYGQKKFAVFSVMYIVLNPITGRILMNPWKDVTFAMAATLLMIYGFRIYITEGQWMQKKGRILALAVILAAVTIVRHNAVLFAIPFLAGIIWYICDKEICFKIVLYYVLLLILVKEPLYHALNVEEEKFRQADILGVPMTVLGNVAKEAPDSFDQETADFMFSVAPREDWQNLYYCGDYNSIKWGERTNERVIEETGAIKVIVMAVRTLFREPEVSLKGLFALTDLVYELGGTIDWEVGHWTAPNDFGITADPIIAGEMWNVYTNVIQESIFKYIFFYVGMINFVIIASILCKCNLREKKEFRKILLCSPILIYNFGTMLLLSGNDFRFFYLGFPILPITLMILYGKAERKEQEEHCMVSRK